VGDGTRLERTGCGARGVLLQSPAQFLDAVLAAVPDAGQAGARAGGAVARPAAGIGGLPAARRLVLQPYGTPVGESRHDQLSGERDDQVLVELSGQQVGGLGDW